MHKTFKMWRSCTVSRPRTWPSNNKSDNTESYRQPAQWMVAASCRRTSLSGPACAWTPHDSYLQGGPLPYWSCRIEARDWHQITFRGSAPRFSSTLCPEVFFTWEYFRRTAEVWNQSFSSLRWPAKGHRDSTARLPVIPLATRSLQVLYSYDQVIRLHRSYRPMGRLPMENSWPASSWFVCNCPVPEAWITEASGPKEIALNNWHIFLPLFAMRQIAAKNRMDTILILQC